jgi:hypothetical protein
MQGICIYIPETNHVSRVCNVAAVLYLQFLLHVMSFRVWNMFCTFTLAIFVVCVQCPIWLFFAVHYYYYYYYYHYYHHHHQHHHRLRHHLRYLYLNPPQICVILCFPDIVGSYSLTNITTNILCVFHTVPSELCVYPSSTSWHTNLTIMDEGTCSLAVSSSPFFPRFILSIFPN